MRYEYNSNPGSFRWRKYVKCYSAYEPSTSTAFATQAEADYEVDRYTSILIRIYAVKDKATASYK